MATIQDHDPHYSRLLNLPMEIRLNIYRHIFTGCSVQADPLRLNKQIVWSDKHFSKTAGIQPLPPSPLLRILLVNRQVYEEALPLFYSHIRFTFVSHNVAVSSWSCNVVVDVFGRLKPSMTSNADDCGIPKGFEARNLVRYVWYAGNSLLLIRTMNSNNLFPSLRVFDFDLGWDHVGNDQTSFDRAMKYVVRNKEWRYAIKDALEAKNRNRAEPSERGSMVHAVWEIQQKSKRERRFTVLLHWRLGYRFVEFAGQCDLDDWVLKIHDPDGVSKNVYEIRQEPLFSEMS